MKDFYFGTGFTVWPGGQIIAGGVILPWNCSFIERISRQSPEIYQEMREEADRPASRGVLWNCAQSKHDLCQATYGQGGCACLCH